MNCLSKGLFSVVNVFADNTSFSSGVFDIQKCVADMSNSLRMISEFSDQYKMRLNTDPFKQAQEVIFSRKTILTYHKPHLKNI